MPSSKSKAAKNRTFRKVKLKVGKTLKKTALTDVNFKAKKLVLTCQLAEKSVNEEKQPLSYRGLSLEDLCKQLGHFNKNMRQNAVIGCKQLLSSRPDLIESQLRTLIPSIARLICDGSNDSSFNAQLRSLLELLCTAPSYSMSAHFQLFLAHTLRALTHLQMSVRTFSLSVLKIVMKSYRDLCRNNTELFDSVVHYLGTGRKPVWNTKGFIECIDIFVHVYDADSDVNIQNTINVRINTREGTSTGFVDMTPVGCPFDVCVLASSVSGSASPFENPEALLQLSAAVAPILYTALSEDIAGAFLAPTLSIIESIGRAVARQPNAFLISDFSERLRKIWDNVKKTVEKRKNNNIRRACAWILIL